MRIRNTWFALAALLTVLLISSNSWDRNGSEIVAESLFAMGIAFAGMGAIGRLWCSLYIAGRKNGTLVTEGPYSMCRNPLYFFSLLGAVGFGLATQTFTVPLIILASFSAYYPKVIREEEKTLASLHGAAYQAYANSTPRFFPRLYGLIEPESYSVAPRIFRKHCISAVWFIVAIGLPELIETLHELKLLPTLFMLY